MGDKQRNGERDREILMLHRSGLSFREIGRRYGLSGQRVRDICDHEEHVDRNRLLFPVWVDFNTKQALRREGITDEKSLLDRAREKGKIYGIGPERIERVLYGEEEIDGERYALSEETRQELIRLLKLDREPEKRGEKPCANQQEERTQRLERALTIAAQMFAAEGYFAPGGDGGPKAIRRWLLKKARAELEQERANTLTASSDRIAREPARRDQPEKKVARTPA